MRVTQKGQVTIPLPVRRALGIKPGSDVEFELDERGARLLVDSSVLLDVFTENQHWLSWSRQQLTQAAQRGAIVVNAIVLAEIAPRFPRIEELRSALPSMTVIEEIPTGAAFLAGHAHADYRRAGGAREAILPDFVIGAHAAVTDRPLLTRDPRRVATYIPGATLIFPEDLSGDLTS